MTINGDITQIDLPRGTKSGLIHGQQTLKQVDGIGMVRFDSSDVIRHPLVSKVISAYEKQEKAEKENTKK